MLALHPRSLTDGIQGLPLSVGLWLPICNLLALLLICWFVPAFTGSGAEVTLPLAAWLLPDALFPRVVLARTRWPGPVSGSLLVQLSAAR